MSIDIFFVMVDIFNASSFLYWALALVRVHEENVAAVVCLLLLLSGTHCHSKFACRVWSVALVSAMLGDIPSAFRLAVLCFALWKPMLPPEREKYQVLVQNISSMSRATDSEQAISGAYEDLRVSLRSFVARFRRTPVLSNDPDRCDEDKLRHRIEKFKQCGDISEDQYRELMRMFPSSAQTEGLLEDLEAFRAEHGTYPRSNKTGVPGSELYTKRRRLLSQQDLLNTQSKAVKETQKRQNQKLDNYDDILRLVLQFKRFPLYHRKATDNDELNYEHNLRRRIEDSLKREQLSVTQYLTPRSTNERYLCEQHTLIMQRLTAFLQSLQANGEEPRMPASARAMGEGETQLRRELDLHKQNLDGALCVLAALIMPKQEEYVFSLIGSDTKGTKKSESVQKVAEAAVRLSQSASACLEESPELQTQFGARLTALERCRTHMNDQFEEIREAHACSSVKDQINLIVRFQEAQGGRLPSLQSHSFEKKSEEEKQVARVLRRLRQARYADVTELRRRKRRVVQRRLTQEEVIMIEEQFGAQIWRDACAPTDYYIPADDNVDTPDGSAEFGTAAVRPSRRIPKACDPIQCLQCGTGCSSHSRLTCHFKQKHLRCVEEIKESFSHERVEEERRK